jgi:PPOX class probable F420-dependent enzyme
VSDDGGSRQVPDGLLYLLTTDHLGHVSSVRPDGGIATHLMWIDWDGQSVLTSSPVGSRKGRNWRLNPHASVSVVDHEDPWRMVSIRGLVTDITPDEGLAFIDKMSIRYVGAPYFRRNYEREIFTITPDHVRASPGRRR